jgi:uncharacterized membrane protein (Fun14 family)
VKFAMSESLEAIKPILYSVGVGGIGGFFIGYVFKKILHLAMMLGVFAFVFLYLAQTNVVNVNFEEIGMMVSESSNFFGESVAPLIAGVPFMGSFAFGFMNGLKRG